MLSKTFQLLHWTLPNSNSFAKSRKDLISSELVDAFRSSVAGCLDQNGYLINCELPNIKPKIFKLPDEILEMKIISSRKIKDDSGLICFLETMENPENLTTKEVTEWIKLIIEKGYYDEKGLNPNWFALNAKCESHWLGIKVAIQFENIVTLHLGEANNGKNNFVNITGLDYLKKGMLTPEEYFFITSSGKASLSLQYILNNIVSTPFIWEKKI